MKVGGLGAFGSVLVSAAVLAGCDATAMSSLQVGGAGGADQLAGGGAIEAGEVDHAGAGASAGSGGSAPVGLAADTPPGETVELTMSGGRVVSAELGIQGAVLTFADSHTALDMTSNLTSPVDASVDRACIAGTAARVDMASDICVTKEFTPPATDCFGEFSGAGVEINLNQSFDAKTGAGKKALPFDASELKGFAFDLDGPTVPRPAALRFSVITTDGGVFCNLPSVKPHAGSNALLFSELVDSCFRVYDDPPTNPTAEPVRSELVKISWQVLTNTSVPVPFDFCISNVRAILK
jgi:hypothetical protein